MKEFNNDVFEKVGEVGSEVEDSKENEEVSSEEYNLPEKKSFPNPLAFDMEIAKIFGTF